MHSPREFVSSTGTPRYWPNYSWLVGSFPHFFRHTTDSSQDCGAKRPTKGSCFQCRGIQFEWRITFSAFPSMHLSSTGQTSQPTSSITCGIWYLCCIAQVGRICRPSPWTGRISHVHSVIFGWCVGAGAYQHLKLITKSHVAPGGFE